MDISVSTKRSRGKSHYVIVKIKLENVLVLICYKHKDYSSGSFLQDLRDIIMAHDGNCIACGDFNIDLIRNTEVNLGTFFVNLGFHNLLPSVTSTTDHGTYIDICFSNYVDSRAFVYETFYSFHKGLCIYWS